MKRIIAVVFISGLVLLMQACATSGSTSDVQGSDAVSGNVTGQNMNYMYRSPSYQIGHM